MAKPEDILTKSWDKMSRAGHVTEAGNSDAYDTGSWSTFKPVLLDTCIHCFQCWVMCPDSAVLVKDLKVVGFDLLHCKGCGICAQVCPDKYSAIEMVKK